MARWSLAQRVHGTASPADIDAAFDRGDFLRTHVLRPTWHYVASDDLRWLMRFSGPRVHARNSRRYDELGLDDGTLAAATDVIADAVAAAPRTRRELATILEGRGLSTEGQRLAYMVMQPARLRTVVLDCPDPLALAEFYRSLIGGEVSYDGDEPDWVVLEPEPGRRLAFQQADDYAPPTWPTGARPQQFHIDLTVDDIDVAEPAVMELGARRHDVQPGEADGDSFRVYLDPVGHPFCLCWD